MRPNHISIDCSALDLRDERNPGTSVLRMEQVRGKHACCFAVEVFDDDQVKWATDRDHTDNLDKMCVSANPLEHRVDACELEIAVPESFP